MFNRPGYSWLATWLAISLLSFSCATKRRSVRSQEVAQPMRVIHKAVQYALTGAIKKKSSNGRVYFSKYHVPGKDLGKVVGGGSKRAQVIITILGGQRPYEVDVLYRIDRLKGGRFVVKGYSKKQAQKYLRLVEEYLASRRDGVDMIDGFRPY